MSNCHALLSLTLLAAVAAVDFVPLSQQPAEQVEHRSFQLRSWLGSSQVWYRNGEQPFWVEEDLNGDWHETWYETNMDRVDRKVYLTDHERKRNCVLSLEEVVVTEWGTDKVLTQEAGSWGELSFNSASAKLYTTDREHWTLELKDREPQALFLAENEKADYRYIYFGNDAGDRHRVSLTAMLFEPADGSKIDAVRGLWKDKMDQEERVRDVTPEVINPGKKVAMLTMNTPNIHNWAVFAERNQIHYALKHDYTLYIYRNTVLPRRIVHWGKILLSQRHLPDHDILMWIDSDAIVTDMEVKIEDKVALAPEKNFYACGDIGGWMLNTGVMIFRNTEWARKMLADLWAKPHVTHANGAEQSTLIKMLRQKDKDNKNWELFEECEFNCHPRHHKEGHYIMHMMGDSGENRKREFTRWNRKFGVDMSGLPVEHIHDEL